MKSKRNQHATYVIFSGALTETADPDRFSISRPENNAAVFTTFITHRPTRHARPALIHLDAHLERLLENAESLGISSKTRSAHSLPVLRRRVTEYTAEFLSSIKEKVEHALIRVVLAESGCELFIDRYENPWAGREGITACSLSAERPKPELKTNLIETSLRARAAAELQGFDEALLLDSRGVLREGAWSNVFWVDPRGRLTTPQHNLLPGITRRAVLSLFEVQLADSPLEEIRRDAQEMFITQSTSGITPVLRLDQSAVGTGRPGPATRLVQQAYSECISREAEELEAR